MAHCYRVPQTSLFQIPSQGTCVNEMPAFAETVDWRRVRRARPLDQLLPGTTQWAVKLPAAIRPVQLLQQYPRIANRLALACHDPKAMQEVLDDVLIDRRGGRRGLPPPVLGELLRLRSFLDGAHTLVFPTRSAAR